MAISNRLVATRRNTLTACLCAAIATTAGSSAFAKALPHATNSTAGARQASRAPSNPFSMFAVKVASPSAHVTSGNVAFVSNCADDGGPDTLRGAIAAASDGDTIDMTGLACSTITLEHGALVSSVSNLTLKGPGADALTIDGNNGDAVIAGGNLDIQDVSIAHGVNLSGFGGCVVTSGDLSLTDVHISACIAANSAAGAVPQSSAISRCIARPSRRARRSAKPARKAVALR